MRNRFRYSTERKKLFRRLLVACFPAVFVITLFSQAAFATTYVITDGSRVYTYTKFTSSPAAVLNAAGLKLDERDSYTTQAADRTAAITICRAQVIHIFYHGKHIPVSSSGETVGQLMSRLDLALDEHDVFSLPPETVTYDGMILQIDRIIRQQQIYTAPIPKEVISCETRQLPKGMTEVLIPGKNGEMLCTAEVTYTNGTETRREIVREQVIVGAFPSVVASGTGTSFTANDSNALPVIGPRTISLPNGQVLTYTHTGTVRATAYTHTDKGCNMTTATGSTVRIGTVAVDPRVIPYGTRMFIMASDGSYVYGIAEAEDCGGDIIGDRVDLYLPTFEDCMEFGRRDCTVYFLG